MRLLWFCLLGCELWAGPTAIQVIFSLGSGIRDPNPYAMLGTLEFDDTRSDHAYLVVLGRDHLKRYRDALAGRVAAAGTQAPRLLQDIVASLQRQMELPKEEFKF